MRIVKGTKKRMGESLWVDAEMADEAQRDSFGRYRLIVSKVANKIVFEKLGGSGQLQGGR